MLRRPLLALSLLVLFAFSSLPAAAGRLPKERIPELLKPWASWVLAGHEEELCPFLSGSGETHCAWPGRLSLDLGERDGRFAQSWTLYADGTVRLPGEERFWPQEVQVDGKPAVALGGEDGPEVALGAGTHTVSGVFHWDSLPESLPVPAETGLLGLTLRGAPVPFPERDAAGRLFLQRTRAAVANVEEDRLEVAVVRRIEDAVPLVAETRIELSVSGRAREVLLSSPLFAGFTPLAVSGPLPARLEPDGRLRVQVRPGSWTIAVSARSGGPVAALSMAPITAPQGPWAAEEVWVFAARPAFRVVDVTGAATVDPQQTRLPEEWKKLLAYRLRPGEHLTFAERRRGDQPPAPDRLQLERTLWLDFAGDGYTFADHVGGVLHGSWRLEMAPPATLGRVAVGGRDQVITRRPGAPGMGIETRLGALDLRAEGRFESALRTVPLAWDHGFEKVSGTLQLPPGWTLLAASGVDHARDTWVSRWSLLDLFLVLIVSLGVRQLWGTRWGLLALAALIISWQESEAPQWVWLFALAAAALLRVLKEGRWRHGVRAVSLVVAAALVLVAVGFLLQELRRGMFPALEYPYLAPGESGMSLTPNALWQSKSLLPPLAGADGAPASAAPAEAPAPPAPVTEAENGNAPVAPKDVPPPPPPPPPPPQSRGRLQSSGYFGSESKLANLSSALGEIDPNAVATTGPGLPRWQWNQVRLEWNGPVEQGERLRLYLLPPGVNRLLALLRAALVALLVLRLLPFVTLPVFPRRPAAVAGLLLITLSAWAAGLSPAPLAAAEVPPQAVLDELRTRLLAPPDCHPECAATSRLFLDLAPAVLTARMEVGAAASTAVVLPGGAQQWVPSQVLLDGKPAAVHRDGEGRLWLVVEPGRHEVQLSGALPPRDTVVLPLPGKPRRVVVGGAGGWTVSGLHEDGVPDDSLQLSRVRPAAGAVPGSGLNPAGAPATLPPFVEVHRTLHLGLLWQVETHVNRRSPPGVPVSLAVPLLPGEAVTTPGVRVDKGRVLVSLSPEAAEAAWTSAFAEAPKIVLQAPRGLDWVEVWQLDASPIWHVEATGIPAQAPTTPEEETGVRSPRWHPWPGERLELAVSRPAGVPGASLTLDASRLSVVPGARSTETTVELDLRSSRGGEQTLTLPAHATLESVAIDGATQPLRQEGERVILPVAPGAHKVQLTFREPRGTALLYRTPSLDLGSPSVNAAILLRLPAERWILLLGGPRLGPAVLFWSLLLVLLLVAAGLSRLPWTPLRLQHWVLLGIGLSQIPLPAAGVVAGWLLVLGWRREKGGEIGRAPVFDLVQIGLVVWTVTALGFLFWAIHQGLLGSPEMQIAGTASTAGELHWFADRAGQVPPTAWALSVPVLVYRLAMLAWALWLAQALLSWLRWGWECLTAGGGWRQVFHWKKPAAGPPPLPPPAPAPVRPEREEGGDIP